jgi:hypothetical protein
MSKTTEIVLIALSVFMMGIAVGASLQRIVHGC